MKAQWQPTTFVLQTMHPDKLTKTHANIHKKPGCTKVETKPILSNMLWSH